ncbi:Uncharacterised protein [Escherichia coli]|nr:Uncharacterised protein [Escherichia coli]
MIDTNRHHATWFQHLPHHPNSGGHEAQPFAMLRTVVFRNYIAQIRVVGIFIPFVVITEILSGIVGRVCQYEINLPSIFIESDHCGKIFSIPNLIFSLSKLFTTRIFFYNTEELRLHLSDYLPRSCSAGVIHNDAIFTGVD